MSENMTILRVEKIKGDKGDKDLSHIRREYDIPTLTNPGSPNFYIHPSECKDVEGRKFRDLFKERLKPGHKPRRDCVKGLHIVFSYTPGALTDPNEIRDWAITSANFFKDMFGEENFVECCLHTDEQSIHGHYITQVFDSDNLPRAKKWLNGPESCRQLQTDYHKVVERFGLSRGIDKRISRRKHKKHLKWVGENARSQAKLEAYERTFGTAADMPEKEQKAFLQALMKAFEEPSDEKIEEIEK